MNKTRRDRLDADLRLSNNHRLVLLIVIGISLCCAGLYLMLTASTTVVDEPLAAVESSLSSEVRSS